MKKKLMIAVLCACAVMKTQAQTSNNVGIGTAIPGSKLTVNGSFAAPYKTTNVSRAIDSSDYYIAYNGTTEGELTLPVCTVSYPDAGNIQGRIYNVKNSSLVPLFLLSSSTQLIDAGGNVANDTLIISPASTALIINTGATSGTVWEVVSITSSEPLTDADASRFLGGSVYAKFNQPTGGTLDTSRVINSGVGTYSIGGVTPNATAGGINSVIGKGYRISNPQGGIYDIQFDVPFTIIYGVAATIFDAYGASGGLPGGLNPTPSSVGTQLYTNDNSQVGFVSNNILRIKTGQSGGALENRSFSFVVMGQ